LESKLPSTTSSRARSRVDRATGHRRRRVRRITTIFGSRHAGNFVGSPRSREQDMAAISKSGTPTVSTASPSFEHQQAGLLAAVEIKAGDACSLTSNGQVV